MKFTFEKGHIPATVWFAFFAALIMFALATASGEKLHSLLFWLYGDLSRGRFNDIWVMIPVKELQERWLLPYVSWALTLS